MNLGAPGRRFQMIRSLPVSARCHPRPMRFSMFPIAIMEGRIFYFATVDFKTCECVGLTRDPFPHVEIEFLAPVGELV
jgi:hypothetical protein